MAEPAIVSGTIAQSELVGMNLDRQRLLDAVAYADRERSFCTGNDVDGAVLEFGYAKLARALRDVFCGDHWVKDTTDNQAGIRHREKPIRIIPMNFDENAGNPDPSITPRAARPKGSATKKKVRCNGTGWLPGLDMPEPIYSDSQTWILGIGPADEDGFVGAELSLPLATEGTKFSKFVTRIILTSKEDEVQNPSKKSAPNSPTDTVDITIARK